MKTTSISNFLRNTPTILRELKESGHPNVLTVNGKAELVVQDSVSYQKLVKLVGRWPSSRTIEP